MIVLRNSNKITKNKTKWATLAHKHFILLLYFVVPQVRHFLCAKQKLYFVSNFSFKWKIHLYIFCLHKSSGKLNIRSTSNLHQNFIYLAFDFFVKFFVFSIWNIQSQSLRLLDFYFAKNHKKCNHTHILNLL